MFLVWWVRKLASLPLQWGGQAAALLKLPAALPLLDAAWHVGGDGSVARMALAERLRHDDPASVRRRAEQWLRRRPCPPVAAVAGLLALDAGQLDAAREHLALGRQHGEDRDGDLDLLAFMLATHSDTEDAADVARQMEPRRDLPAHLSILLHTELLWAAMRDGRFDEARRRAERLLAVRDHPKAEMALYALALREDDPAAAEAHRARATLPDNEKLYFQALGLIAVGRRQQADEALAELEQYDTGLAAAARRFRATTEVPRWTS